MDKRFFIRKPSPDNKETLAENAEIEQIIKECRPFLARHFKAIVFAAILTLAAGAVVSDRTPSNAEPKPNQYERPDISPLRPFHDNLKDDGNTQDEPKAEPKPNKSFSPPEQFKPNKEEGIIRMA